MIICSCNVLTDHQVRAVLGEAARTPGSVYRCLGCKAQCGRCAVTIRRLIEAELGPSAACASACNGCPVGEAVSELAEDRDWALAVAAE